MNNKIIKGRERESHSFSHPFQPTPHFNSNTKYSHKKSWPLAKQSGPISQATTIGLSKSTLVATIKWS